MPNYDDIERVFDLVDEARIRESKASGFPVPLVADDEKAEAYRWANGNELKNIVDTPGFEIIMYKLQTYMDEGIKTLLVATIPTDKNAVLANFALAHAACEIFERLKNDIHNDIEAAKSVPDIVKQGIRITRGVPVDAASI
jgi:hypothetical protein